MTSLLLNLCSHTGGVMQCEIFFPVYSLVWADYHIYTSVLPTLTPVWEIVTTLHVFKLKSLWPFSYMAGSPPLMQFPSPNQFQLNNPCREFNKQLVQEENKEDVTDEKIFRYSVPLYQKLPASNFLSPWSLQTWFLPAWFFDLRMTRPGSCVRINTKALLWWWKCHTFTWRDTNWTKNTDSLQNSATWSKTHSRSCYLQYVLLRPLQRVGKNCHHLIPDNS